MSVFFLVIGLLALLTPQVLAWGTLSQTACLTIASGVAIEPDELEGAPRTGGNNVQTGGAPPPPWAHGPGGNRPWNNSPPWSNNNAVNNTPPFSNYYPHQPYPQYHPHHHRHTSTEEEVEVRRKRAHGYPPFLPPITGTISCPEGRMDRMHIRRVWSGYSPGTGSCESGWPHCRTELSPADLDRCEGGGQLCSVSVASRYLQHCSQPTNYVYVQYECIDVSRKVDMCTWRQGELLGAALVTSHKFPGGDVVPTDVTLTCECHVSGQGLTLTWADGELEAGPGGRGCGREAVLLEERGNDTWTLREEICGAGSLDPSHVPVKGGELRMTYLAAGPLGLSPNRRGVFMKLMAEDRWGGPGRIHVSCREMRNRGHDPRLRGSPASSMQATLSLATHLGATPPNSAHLEATPPERVFPPNPRFHITPRTQSTAAPTVPSRPRHHLPRQPNQEDLTALQPTNGGGPRTRPSGPRLRGGLSFQTDPHTPPPPPNLPSRTMPPPPPPHYLPQNTMPPPTPPHYLPQNTMPPPTPPPSTMPPPPPPHYLPPSTMPPPPPSPYLPPSTMPTPPSPLYLPPSTMPPPPPPPYLPPMTMPPSLPSMPSTTTTGPVGNGMDDTSLDAVRRPPPSNPRSANRNQMVTMTTAPPQIHHPADISIRSRHGRVRVDNSVAGAGAVHGEGGTEAKTVKSNTGHTTAAVVACVVSIIVIVASLGGYVLFRRRRTRLQQLKENAEGASQRGRPWTVSGQSSGTADPAWDSPVYNDPANPSPPPLPNRPPTLPKVKGKKSRASPAPPTVGGVNEAPPTEGTATATTPTQASFIQATPLLTSIDNPTPYAYIPDSEVEAGASFTPNLEYDEPIRPHGQASMAAGRPAAGRRGRRGAAECVYDNNMELRCHVPTFEGCDAAREVDYAQIVDMQKIVLE